MKKLHLTHKVFTASVVGAVTVTTSVAAVFAYQAVTQYKPSSSKEEMKNNQVLFNNNKNSLSNNSKNEQNSKWLEKQDQKNKQDATQNSNYLFDKNQEVTVQKTMTLNTQTTTSETDSSQNTKSDSSNTVTDSDTNTVVDVDKNAKNPDIIIDDKSNSTSGEDNTGKGDNSGSGTIDPALPDSNHKPTPSPGDNTNPGGNTSNNKYDKVKDPVDIKDKVNQNFFRDDFGHDDGKKTDIKDYSNSQVKETEKNQDYKMIVLIQPSTSIDFQLYQGATITEESLLNMMVTGVFFKYSGDESNHDVFYSWDSSALGRYIKINGISTDGGKTWIKNFPYQIEKGVTSIQWDISYRLSEKDEWTRYIPENASIGSMDVSETKVMVLKNQLDKDASEVKYEDIINSSEMYLSVGDTLDLLDKQFFVLDTTKEGIYNDKGELNYLFPGWSENGEKLNWVYTVTEGRHIIEPMDLLPLDSKYIAKLRYANVMIDGNMKYDGLQTLVGTTVQGKLAIPEYIQMVDFEEEKSFNSIELSDTVMVVSDANISVKDKWIVSKDNPYLAVKDGILMSKDLTEIISVPTSVKELKIVKDVTKISAKNLNGTTLYLEADSLDELPEIEFSYYIGGQFKNLNNCKIVLKDSVFDEYIADNYESIVECENITFAKASNPDKEYTVKNHCIAQENTLYKAITGVSTIHLDDNIDTIGKNAFKSVKRIKNIILNDSLITLEEGCFDDSSIKHIYCSTQEQKEYLEKRLKELGYDEIEVSLEEAEVKGFKYKIDEDGTITLLKAPSDIIEFNGVVNDVQFDVIGDGAFKDCTSLTKVYLPENIKVIGEEAFENCSSLEMMIIDSRDTIDIGMNAFEGLYNIRMLASNAQYANMNGYTPGVSEANFFIPSFNSGYDYGYYFLGGYGAYTFESIGASTEAIYLNTWDGTPFLLLAAPIRVDSQVVLPDTTSQIYSWSMAHTYAGDGEGYTINLGSLDNVYYNSYAFYNSNISGNLTIGAESYIEGYAFDSCQYIDSVEILDKSTVLGQAFAECQNIVKVKMKNGDELGSGAFESWWGSSLSEIEFEGKIPEFTMTESDWKFVFTGPFADDVHITLTNASMTKEEFVKKYMYLFAGYTDSDGVTASQAVWNEIVVNLKALHWDDPNYIPPYEDVYAGFKDTLLEFENYLRTMLDMDTVEEPTWMPTDIPTKEEYEGTKEKEEEDKEAEDKKEDSESSNKETEESEDTEESKDDSDENQSGESNDSEVETPTEQEIPNTDDVGDDSTTPDVQSDTIQIQDIQENEEDFQ